jgi:hypothetical protein
VCPECGDLVASLNAETGWCWLCTKAAARVAKLDADAAARRPGSRTRDEVLGALERTQREIDEVCTERLAKWCANEGLNGEASLLYGPGGLWEQKRELVRDLRWELLRDRKRLEREWVGGKS